MATHSSVLAWSIPWTEEPGLLWSTGSQRVGYDQATKRVAETLERGPGVLSLVDCGVRGPGPPSRELECPSSCRGSAVGSWGPP